MTTTILKGTIVSAAAAGAPEITEGGYLVAEDGVITGVFPTLPERYTGAPVEDFHRAPMNLEKVFMEVTREC